MSGRIAHDTCNNSILTCVFVASEAFLGGIQLQIHGEMGGIYEVRRWMGLGTKISMPSFIKIGLGIQKLIRENIRTQTT
jgi:hypothetical protein